MNNQRESGLFKAGQVKGWAAILLLAATALLSLYLQRPPDAAPASLPPEKFSSNRALAHLKVIAAAPRPVGSPAHNAARDYLLGELRRLGLEADVQKTTGINARQIGSATAATVENIVGRYRGAGGGRAVLLAAHYDTVPGSFGASDDGAAIAALLEVARALKSGTPLKNDVIFLFTDGEECGLLGAEAFVSAHPWAKEVALVGNFEARGNSGPVFMFETSRVGDQLVGQFGEAADRLFANSLMPELYRLLPNDTDFTVFKAAGMPGFNFAYIEGATRYHTRLDNYQELDERSLQHHGQYALALARRFGDADLNTGGQAETVYFDVLGAKLISYPKGWTLPLMLAVYVLLAVIILLGFKRKRFTLSGLVLGVLAFVANAVAALIVVSLAWRVIALLDTESARAHAGDPYNASYYLVGLVLLVSAVTAALNLLLARRVGFTNLLAGALLCWGVAMTLGALFLPGSSYLFIWPLFFVLAGVGVAMANGDGGANFNSNEALILSLCAVPGVLLLAPLTKSLHAGLGVRNIALVVLPLILLLGLLLPALDFLLRAFGKRLPVALFAAGLLLLVAGGFATRFDGAHPEPDSLFYVLDAERNQAIWLSFDAKPGNWTGQFIPAGAGGGTVNDYLPNFLGKFLNAPAPIAQFAPPSAEIISDERSAGVRRLSLRITSPRKAAIVTVCAESGARILSASVNNRSLAGGADARPPAPQGVWTLEYYAPDPEGFVLTLEVDPASPLKLKVFDASYGLPSVPGLAIRPRTDNSMPTPDGAFYQDTTIVTKSYSFAQVGG